MGGSSSTYSTIPAELKPLFRSTAAKNVALQNYFWGAMPSSIPPGDTGDTTTPGDPNTSVTTTGPTGGPGVLSPAPDQEAAAALEKTSPPIGTTGITDLDQTGMWTPGQYDLTSILSSETPTVPGLSPYQQQVGKLIPGVATQRPGEQFAQDMAWNLASGQGNNAASDFAARKLHWTLAGRTGTAGYNDMYLNNPLDLSTNPIYQLAGQMPSVGAGGGDGGGMVEDGGGGGMPPGMGDLGALGGATSGGGAPTSWGTFQKPGSDLNARINEALNLYEQTTGEQTRNELESAGLGSSLNLNKALSSGRASMIMPLISEDLAYQQKAKEMQLSEAQRQAAERMQAIAAQATAAEQQAGRIEREAQQGQAGKEFATQTMLSVSDKQRQALLDALGLGVKQGELERGIATEQQAADEQERLRLQALAEQSLFGPLGGFVPSTLGSSTSK